MAVYLVIEPDGTQRRVDTTANGAKLMTEIRNAIGVDAIEALALPNGTTWLLAFGPAAAGLPVNHPAMQRYQAIRPGMIEAIRGPVVLVADTEFDNAIRQ